MADVYGSITDDAVNRIIAFTHARAPFLFNYVAPSLRLKFDGQGQLQAIEDLWLTCSDVPVPADPNVPRYTRIDPFKLPGIPVALPLSIQLIDLKFDFQPGDAIGLPPQLNPPLVQQAFAMKLLLDIGVPCVPPAAADSLQQFGTTLHPGMQLPVLPIDSLDCFVLQVFATARLRVDSVAAPPAPQPVQQIRVDVLGIEIVDIAPTGLENAIECYLVTLLKAYILPSLVLALEPLVVKSLDMTLTPTLTGGLPNNPAVEHNELRVWLDLDIK